MKSKKGTDQIIDLINEGTQEEIQGSDFLLELINELMNRQQPESQVDEVATDGTDQQIGAEGSVSYLEDRKKSKL